MAKAVAVPLWMRDAPVARGSIRGAASRAATHELETWNSIKGRSEWPEKWPRAALDAALAPFRGGLTIANAEAFRETCGYLFFPEAEGWAIPGSAYFNLHHVNVWIQDGGVCAALAAHGEADVLVLTANTLPEKSGRAHMRQWLADEHLATAGLYNWNLDGDAVTIPHHKDCPLPFGANA